jgi:hypothetical protein
MAYLYLHTRRNLPDTYAGLTSWRRDASSCSLRDHVTQAEQVRWPTVGPSPRDGDERIDLRDVGPRRGQRGERTSIVLIEHAVLTPRLPDRQQLERPPRQRMKGVRDTKDSMRSPLINSS